MNKKAFSLIEVLISVSIIIILAIVATTTSNNLKSNSNNSKVIADLNTVENALVSYKTETSMLPNPGWNNNLFDIEWNYVSNIESTDIFWIYWKITENTIEKRFLDVNPLDPRTNQYYSYWIAKNEKEFEIAWVLKIEDNYIAKVTWDYRANTWIYSLIREYNWANFISDKSSNLPYNPEERILVATDNNWNVYKEWDIIRNEGTNDLEIFFSDWSTSVISSWTILTLTKMDFPKENNLVSNIKLFLQAWSIWTKATKLSSESSFDVNTSDLTASVRWTVFWVEKLVNNTIITVLEWRVEVEKEAISTYIWWDYFEPVNPIYVDTINVIEWQNPKKMESSNPIISMEATLYGFEELWIEYTQPIMERPQVAIIEDKIASEIIEESETKDCYLEDLLVKDGDQILWYKDKYVDSWSTCSIPVQRYCVNGRLWWDKDYKYNNCSLKAQNQCNPYDSDGYLWDRPLNIWMFDTVVKTEPIKTLIYSVWTLNSSKEITCIDWVNYSEGIEIKTPNCDAWFIPDWLNCKCDLWKDFFEWSCYDNPFGVDYELVKVVPTIEWSYFWLNTGNVWVNLWSGFWLVFDTNWVSQDGNKITYLYTYTWPEMDIVFSTNKRLRLWSDSWVYKYSTIDLWSLDNKNIILRFNWNIWDDLSWNITSTLWTVWTPVNINSQYLKIKNATDIKIFKKNSWIFYSWFWCGSCPDWYTENTFWLCSWNKTCNWISWGNNICKEKSLCSWSNENWSWIYNP